MSEYLSDIGNLHIIDYYLHHATKNWRWGGAEPAKEDFDIKTEQREGWAYDTD